MHITAHHPLTNSHSAPRAAGGVLNGVIAWIDRTYARWQEHEAELHALETMTDRDLRDAGLTRFAVEREITRPFWRG